MAKRAQNSTKASPRTADSRTAGNVPGGKTAGTRGAARKAAPRRGSQTLLLAVVVGVVLVAAAIIIFAINNAQAPLQSTNRVGDGTAWGPANAPVVIEEYSDYGCSHCADFALGTGEQLRAEYAATGKVRFVYNHFIIGGTPTANAANAAECAADQGRFWDYSDGLFNRQTASADPFNKTALKQYAADLGLDTAQFNRCVDSDQHLEKVYQDTNTGRGRGVKATPSFFIGSQMIEGAIPYADFKAAIDAALAAAE